MRHASVGRPFVLSYDFQRPFRDLICYLCTLFKKSDQRGFCESTAIKLIERLCKLYCMILIIYSAEMTPENED